MNRKLSSRKFLVTVLALGMGFVALGFGWIDQAGFLLVIQWTFTGYVLGNLSEHYITNGRGAPTT